METIKIKRNQNTVTPVSVSFNTNGTTYNLLEVVVTPQGNKDNGRHIPLYERQEQQKMNHAINSGMNKAGQMGFTLADMLGSAAFPAWGLTSGLIHGAMSAKDIKDNGLNWNNGLGAALGLGFTALHLPKVYNVANNGLTTLKNSATNMITAGREVEGTMNNMNIVVPQEFSWVTSSKHVQPRTMTWGKAQIVMHDMNTGSPYNNHMGNVVRTISRGPYHPEGLQIKGKSFGKFIGGGDEQEVFENLTDPTKVLKVYKQPFRIKGMKEHNSNFLWERNTIPFFARQKFVGFVKNEVNQRFPVYTQEKLTPLQGGTYFQQHIMPRIQNSLNQKGFSGDGINSNFTNGKITIGDLKPENIGIDTDGKIRFLDLNVYHHYSE